MASPVLFDVNETELASEQYCHVCVTLDGVWIGDSIYWPLIHSQLVTTLYKSLTHRVVSVISLLVATSRFLETDFNTVTITVSLNYSKYHIYHILFTTGLWSGNLPELPRLITSRHGPTETKLFYCFVWIRCRRDVFTSPLRSNVRGMDVWIRVFLISALVGCALSDLRLDRLPSGKEPPVPIG
jgi:hypothetical protein